MFFTIYIKCEHLVIKCVPFSVVLCSQLLDRLDVSDRSSFFATGGFLLLWAGRVWPIIECRAPPIGRGGQPGFGHQCGRHRKAAGCLCGPAAPQHPSGQRTMSATTHDQNIYGLNCPWGRIKCFWIELDLSYPCLWFHTPHCAVFLWCALPVQVSTATRSRPTFTWLVPAPYPCPSPSSTVPEPSTSAGTTWRMLSGQYSAVDRPQFHGRASLWHHREGSHLPGQHMAFFNFRWAWIKRVWSFLCQ